VSSRSYHSLWIADIGFSFHYCVTTQTITVERNAELPCRTGEKMQKNKQTCYWGNSFKFSCIESTQLSNFMASFETCEWRAVSYFDISPRAPKEPSCAHPLLPVSSGQTVRSSWKKFSLAWKYCIDVSEKPAAPFFRVDRNFYTDCCQSFKSLMIVSYSLLNVITHLCYVHGILLDSNMVIFPECVNILRVFPVE
jgi:hypothetical protein